MVTEVKYNGPITNTFLKKNYSLHCMHKTTVNVFPCSLLKVNICNDVISTCFTKCENKMRLIRTRLNSCKTHLAKLLPDRNKPSHFLKVNFISSSVYFRKWDSEDNFALDKVNTSGNRGVAEGALPTPILQIFIVSSPQKCVV